MIKQLYRFLNPKFQNLFLEYRVNFKPRYGYEQPPHPELMHIIDSNRNLYMELLNKALTYKAFIWLIRDSKIENDYSKPTWNNGYLPGLDIIGLYTILSEVRPSFILKLVQAILLKLHIRQKLNRG